MVKRSTTVIARRVPAARPGHGKAARYVSGRAPVVAKTTNKPDASGNPAAGNSDEARLAQLLDDAWTQQRQKMAEYVFLLSAFMMFTWWTRMLTSRPEPKLPPVSSAMCPRESPLRLMSAIAATKKVSEIRIRAHSDSRILTSIRTLDSSVSHQR